MKHEEKITQNLIMHSVTNNVSELQAEWEYVTTIEGANHCNLCGHKIKYNIVIKNKLNGIYLNIGSECADYVLNTSNLAAAIKELDILKKKISRRTKAVKQAKEFDERKIKSGRSIIKCGKIVSLSNMEFVELEISQGRL